MVVLRWAPKAALVLLLLIVSGCFIFELGSRESSFNHERHVEEEGLECQMCHSRHADADQAGMPTMDQCRLCHEGIDEDKPPEKQLSAIYGEEPSWSYFTALAGEVRFSHKVHHAAGLDCSECHGDVAGMASMSSIEPIEKSDCMDCHAQSGAPNECGTCHTQIDSAWQPASHAANWTRLHGDVVRAQSAKSADDCKLCHSDSRCVQCHNDEAPRSHNNQWRQFGHGLSASIDRDSCATCHRTDFCQRCHEDTAPRSHNATFGSPLNRHCVSCHFPIRDEGCITCHRAALSHFSATSLPSNDAHRTASAEDCRACHVPLKISHLDNGDDCRICHR